MMEWDEDRVEVVICPQTIHLNMAKDLIKDNMSVGAQNISRFSSGAYTGELSGDQLKDFQLKWVIIGHSERRTLFNETNLIVAEKIRQA